MQLVEASVIGVRSARLTLDSTASADKITLFPMIHVGEAAFYDAVYADALTHDVVLIEGVKSPITSWITTSYRWVAGNPRLGLMVQPRFPEVTPPSCRVVHADLEADEFERLWRKLPFLLRALIHVVAPAVGLRRRWGETRETLARHLTLDDQPAVEELLRFHPETALLNNVILDARDDVLIRAICIELDRPTPPPRVAIVYGAAHMRAVLKALTARRFVARGGSWIPVFGF